MKNCYLLIRNLDVILRVVMMKFIQVRSWFCIVSYVLVMYTSVLFPGHRSHAEQESSDTFSQTEQQSAVRPADTSPQRLPDPFLDRLILEVVELVHHEEFDAAFELCEKALEYDSSNPIGYFLKAAVYDTVIRDYRYNLFKEEFVTNVTQAVDRAREWIEREGDNPWAYFFYGGSLGYRGVQKMDDGDWFGAFKDGARGVKAVFKVVELAPGMYDCYFGIGSYHYWAAAMMDLFWWLRWIEASKMEGIEELKIAVEKGRYTRIESAYALLRVYNNEGMYLEALDLSAWLEEFYPRDIFCLWFRGEILGKLGMWEESLEVYRKLLTRLMVAEYHGVRAEVECLYHMAEAYSHQGDYEKTIEYAQTVIETGEKNKDNYLVRKLIRKARSLMRASEKRLRKQREG